MSTRANGIDLYRPPAARKLATNNTTPTTSPTFLSSIANNSIASISKDNHSTATGTNYKSFNNIQQSCTIDSTNINDINSK